MTQKPPALGRKLASARSLDSLSGSFYAPDGNPDDAAGRARRKLEAEKILEEIAREYAAKRAAGLVPSVPVPARTLLWEELERRERSRVGRRGQCVFGRDSDAGACGCVHYKRQKLKAQPNPGGLCESCGHGGPWHRLTGGSNTQRTSNGYTRSYAGSSVRASRVGSVSRSDAPSQHSLALSEYDEDEYYDDEYDDDEYDEDEDEEDDDDIALEVARPYDPYQHQQHQLQQQQQYTTHYHTPPVNRYTASAPPTADSDFDLRDSLLRSSMLSSGSSSLGLPPRNSSGAPQLDALLRAINRYRQQGLSEDEVERRIAVEFPPAPRRNSVRVSSSYVSGELASI